MIDCSCDDTGFCSTDCEEAYNKSFSQDLQRIKREFAINPTSFFNSVTTDWRTEHDV